jgi:hypothetical protein
MHASQPAGLNQPKHPKPTLHNPQATLESLPNWPQLIASTRKQAFNRPSKTPHIFKSTLNRPQNPIRPLNQHQINPKHTLKKHHKRCHSQSKKKLWKLEKKPGQPAPFLLDNEELRTNQICAYVQGLLIILGGIILVWDAIIIWGIPPTLNQPGFIYPSLAL